MPRQIRMKVPALIGGRHCKAGDVVEVPDDRRAALIVSLGHAEHVAPVAGAVPPAPEKADAPKAPEKADAPKADEKADAPKAPEKPAGKK